MHSEQQKRLARNESRFRDLNDQLAAAVAEFRGANGDQTFDAACECALDQCNQMVPITFAAYRHVRSNPTWFLVRPDHVTAEVEFEVERHGDYSIVQKIDEGARVALRLA